ncbi:MAG: preprotein translocase subunit SecG [Treponema sp.]|jgi:preprotein translocase subunit SecG|nr:preprotein translocase subunit SecG [Treponema sp.]
MGVLSIVLLVFFVIVAVLLVLIVLIQNEEGDSLGGIFAGGSSSAFGSRSGNILTRTTSILGALFLVLSLALALSNRIPAGEGVESAGRELLNESRGPTWVDEELNARDGESQNIESPDSVLESPGVLEAPSGTALPEGPGIPEETPETVQ